MRQRRNRVRYAKTLRRTGESKPHEPPERHIRDCRGRGLSSPERVVAFAVALAKPLRNA
jgi:hypothetical protein